ncbi:cytochrome oxidase maturation protein, cbb3-type [Nonlabens dokdonensis]|uniref:Cytochrome oxidase maturation protein, cbb3-type n=1 Tax=Nonlabens dokdonensis TaxID=328515 RepID=A0A1Z8AKA3_9FLAO|nr:cbb3-type cytochrome oxidase assembly protein CcoS [Nonlabens dokdonensis]OUS10760.1 cytochrome oxidase maturation protein, cbb3-type [Nonlabens dokdonensis]
MNIIYMLLAISVVVALLFLAAFIFSVKLGQYDDTYTPSVRMLFDDELIKENPKEKQQSINLNQQPK